MNHRAFTLIEIVLVLSVVGLSTLWVMPRLRPARSRSVALVARQLADAINLARDRAILSQHPAAILLDLDRQQWREADSTAQPVTLPPAVRFESLVIGGEAAKHAGQHRLALDPAGDRLPTTIELRDDAGHGARVHLPPARARAIVHAQERS